VLGPPIAVVNHSVLVQTNAGFSITRMVSAQPGLLFQAAESALSRCTPSERYVIYDPESVSRESDTWAIKVELEEALQRGELIPYFEPVVSTAFNNIIAAASTLAWNSPKRGLQGFSKFMAMARDCEMLQPVYWHYLKGAIGQAAKWQETVGIVLQIPVELLNDDEVAMQLQDTLELYSIVPQRLTIEVPETALANADCRVVLEAVRQRKIAVRIAGMGEGGLPLIMLGNLPVDEVSVARALLSKSVPPALRTLILELFKRAGYRLIATGIKEEKLVPKLKELGFHAIQGPAVGGILPYNDFAAWLKKKIGT
jgi:EAL domain-containing protein (putative c-di-GMP-specific phosphodiesterase class I)